MPDPNLYGPSDGYLSKPIILVADTVDNTFKNDNAQNDQTHIAALGSKVEFRIKQANGDIVGALPVKKKKAVHVDLKLLWQGTDAPTQQSLDNITADTKIAKEIYAQVGIDVTFTISGSPVTLEGVNLLDGLNLDNRGELLSEGEAVLNNYATPNQADVIGLYIEGGIVTNAAAGVSNGIAIWDNQELLPHSLFPNLYWHDAVSAKYKGTFLINAARSSRATLSHELGHVLGLLHPDQEKNHRDTSAPTTRNIMYGGGTSYDDSYAFDSKRFRAFQKIRIHSSQFAKPIQE